MTACRTAMVRAALALAPLIMTIAVGDARAQTSGAVFAGAEFGRDWSASAGVAVSIQPQWAVRGSAATGGYDYVSNGIEVEGEYDQAELVLLHQRSGAWGYFNVGGGVRYADTTLTPDDPGNERRGGQWDALVTADGVRRLGEWEAGGFASYGIDQQEYYVRGRITRALGSSRVRLGVEAIAQGDPNYDRQGVAALGLYRTGPLELALSVGTRGGEGQVSIGVVRAF